MSNLEDWQEREISRLQAELMQSQAHVRSLKDELAHTHSKIKRLGSELAHWKHNHDEQVKRNNLLKARTI